MKIHSKRGHLANVFWESDQGDMLWEQGSLFKVARKDYDPETDTYFMQINEVNPYLEASPERILDAGTGNPVRYNGTRCL